MPKTNTRITKSQRRVTAAKTATDTSSTSSSEEGVSFDSTEATTASIGEDFAGNSITIPPVPLRKEVTGRPITTTDFKNIWVIGTVVSTLVASLCWAVWWMASVSTTVSSTSDDLKEVRRKAENIDTLSTRNAVRVDNLETRTSRLENKVEEFGSKNK